MQVTPSRVVAFVVTPILTAATAVGTGWLEKHFPGLPTLDASQLVAIEITAGASAAAACLKWLHGWSLWERSVRAVVPVVKLVEATVNAAAPGATGTFAADAQKLAEAEAAKVADAFADLTPPANAYPPPPAVVSNVPVTASSPTGAGIAVPPSTTPAA